jgi:hypothetical protein
MMTAAQQACHARAICLAGKPPAAGEAPDAGQRHCPTATFDPCRADAGTD